MEDILELVATQKSKKLARGHLEIIFLCMALLVVACTAILYVVGNRTLASNADQKVIQARIENIENVLSGIREAETAERGFLLTHEAIYLEQFNDAANRFGAMVGDLKDISNSNANLIKSSNKELGVLHSAIDALRAGRKEAANQIVLASRDRGFMSALRARLRELAIEQERELEREMKDQDRLTQLRTALFLVTGALNIVFLGWAYGRISHGLEETEAAASLRYQS